MKRRSISIVLSMGHCFKAHDSFFCIFSVPSITGDIPIISTDFQHACEQAKTIFITAHVGPDGDTLGSMLALKFAFEKASQISDRFAFERIDCVIAGKMPHVYHFLPGIDTVHNIETSQSLLEQYDLAISVDCGSLDRLGPSGAVFAKAKKTVNIDHHISNQCFADINLVIPQACASGQVIFDILNEMLIPLDANIATCIYTAVVTDTGGFKYSNTNAKVFEMVADLVKAGAEPEYIYKQIYEIRPLSQFRIQAEAFKNTQFNDDYSLGWTQVSQEMLKTYAATEDQIDGLVEGIR
ncbi:MAG: DHH family phosphoesterase, partial [Cyanobacteria bacterium]|nr:DHH family phosphoesterase [Cyanobacteriota bacterium]